MRKFESLSPSEALKVYSAVLQNSSVLLKSASLSAEAGHYGVARSLLILSTEEYLKGVTLLLYGSGIRILSLKELKGIFKIINPSMS